MEQISNFFSINKFIPHGHCFLWEPTLLWTLVISDALIAISYYSIPIALIIAVGKRRNDSIKWIILMFSAFIFACGTTHLIDIATIWYPNYWLDASAKMITGLISAATAIALWPTLKKATAYVDVTERHTEQLSDSNIHLRQSLNALEQQRSDLQRLNKLSGLLHVCNSFEEIASAVTDTLQRIFPDSSGGLFLAESDENTFRLLSDWGNSNSQEIIQSQQCWSYRLGHIFPDTSDISTFSCGASSCGMKSDKFCIPIIAVGKTIGLLHLINVNYVDDERTQSVISVLAERVGLAIYNLQLKNSLEFRSTRDSLTGLFNRRYLDDSLDMEERRARRLGNPMSVILFDLDNFKTLNDTHGHEKGDHALKLFADILNNNLRAGDIACRYGGEEFVLVMPGSNKENAARKADQIRQDLIKSVESNSMSGLRDLSVSAGVASYPEDGQNTMSVIRAADGALYKAKNSGKNSVKVAD